MTVRRLAQLGARVVIAEVSDERGEALVRAVGAGSLSVPADGMDEDTSATAVKTAAGLGPLRCAVQTSPRHAATFAGDNPYWPFGAPMRMGALMEVRADDDRHVDRAGCDVLGA